LVWKFWIVRGNQSVGCAQFQSCAKSTSSSHLLVQIFEAGDPSAVDDHKWRSAAFDSRSVHRHDSAGNGERVSNRLRDVTHHELRVLTKITELALRKEGHVVANRVWKKRGGWRCYWLSLTTAAGIIAYFHKTFWNCPKPIFKKTNVAGNGLRVRSDTRRYSIVVRSFWITESKAAPPSRHGENPIKLSLHSSFRSMIIIFRKKCHPKAFCSTSFSKKATLSKRILNWLKTKRNFSTGFRGVLEEQTIWSSTKIKWTFNISQPTHLQAILCSGISASDANATNKAHNFCQLFHTCIFITNRVVFRN